MATARHTPPCAAAKDILTRRSLLRASPALLAPELLASTALASSANLPTLGEVGQKGQICPFADPLPGLWAACQRAEAAWLATPEGSPEADALWDEFKDHEAAMEETVATTPAGLLAQLDYMAASYGSGCLEPEERPCVHDVPLTFLDTLKAGLGRLGA